MKKLTILVMALVLMLVGKAYAGLTGTTTVDSNVFNIEDASSSLAFDPSDDPGIAYYHENFSQVRYAHWNGSSWDINTVESGITAGPPSLAFRTNGNPALSYHDLSTSGSETLKYVQWNGSSWDIAVVESNIGGEASLAFDNQGYPGISYHDDDIDALKYAHWNGSSWNIEVVPGTSYVCSFTSLAYDPSGFPGITYYDEGPDDTIKYVHWNGSSWGTPEKIDPCADAGEETSLAFDNQGYPNLSYHDDNIDALKYAHWNGCSWDITIVDSSSSVCSYTSLAFDQSGFPAISYYDEGPDNALKYVHWNGSSWGTPEIVASATEEASSLAFDSSGKPGISFYDSLTKSLRYAEFDVSATIVLVDIKPGSDPNSINLNSAGVVPVAILSSDTFDATTVDPETVALAGARIRMVGKSSKFLSHEEDVNGDGLIDLVCQVYTAEFMIEVGETVAVLEGKTYDGTPIRGEDTVRIVPDN